MNFACMVPKGSIVAVSSGVDSIAAAHILYHKRLIDTVYHHNHNLRPQNDEMEQKCRMFCEDFGLKQIYFKSNLNNKTEDDFRKSRINSFFENRKSTTLVTAHHLDDATESYLLNVFRGHEGWIPIPIFSKFPDDNMIIHPFLLFRKKFFIDYCEQHDLMKYVVEDETNHVIKHSRRNMIRNEIIPVLNREKMGIHKIVKKKILERKKLTTTKS